ncbi:MAG: AI-2E family transporter [Gammaproteobacteria bacterium]|jgi:predicted PurR-regulated permease PerM
MSRSSYDLDFDLLQKRVIELAIRMGTLFVLLLWCFTIVEPFVMIVVWGIIVAVALYPVFAKLASLLGNRQKLSATLLSLVLVGTLAVPTFLLTESLIAGARALANAGDAGALAVPPPSESVAEWPIIGERAYELWQKASADLPAVLEEFTPQIKAFGTWALSLATGTGLGVLQFIVSFVIAGVLLATADKGAQATHALATRLAGSRGSKFAGLAVGTIRNVAIGILGVAIVQTALLSLGFLVADIPGAGLLALIVLILCIIQLGPGLVSIPAIIYVFSTADTTAAAIFAIWTIVMTLIDSVLKPMVFGRGAQVPTLVIFLGAIGGMLAYGIIGLFVGAVVLSLGYKLYETWLQETPPVDQPSTEPTPAD